MYMYTQRPRPHGFPVHPWCVPVLRAGAHATRAERQATFYGMPQYICRSDLTDLIIADRQKRAAPDGQMHRRLVTFPELPPAPSLATLASRGPATAGASLSDLYRKECASAASKRQKAQAVQARLAALGAARDRLGPPPRLLPHDIPVITLDGALTGEALQKLLCHECCAVHVRGFIRTATCSEIASRLRQHGEAFSNWRLNQAEAESAAVATEVDKIGVTSGHALDSLELFAEYLCPSSPTRLDALLPGNLNPFSTLRASLNALHTHGCRLNQLGGWPQPAGTFRRMRGSQGLIHADSVTLLERDSGQFSANIYVQTPPGSGALSVYPAQQYAAADGRTPPELLANLQSLALKQVAARPPVPSISLAPARMTKS